MTPTVRVIPFPIASIPHRFVSPEWCDTVADLSRNSNWCAVMVPVRPHSGRVLGFVQSIYLYLPDLDASPNRRASFALRHRTSPRLISR